MNHSRLLIALALTLLLLTPLGAQTTGWRGDASGAYPHANPPLEWAPDRHVLWKAALPAWSNALPVIVGQKIFVMSEPGTLLCLSSTDGAILWQHDNDILETLEPAKADEVRQLRQQLAEVPSQIGKTEAELRTLRQRLKDKPDDAQITADIQAASERLAELRRQWAPLAPYDPPATHSLTGYTSGTPVTDGVHIWILLGNGVAACYDLDGQRQWIRFVDPSVLGYGHSASPVLAGQRLILLHKELVALDPRSGEVAWRCPSPARWGTPLPLRIGEVDVVITPSGQAVRAHDGAVLATGLPDLKYSSPLRHGDVLYFVDEAVRGAYRIPQAIDNDKLAFVELWKIPQKTERFYASPVLHGELLFSITQRSEFFAWNAGSGEVVLEQKADLGGGTVYPSPILARDLIYLSGDAGIVQVVKPAAIWEPVARNNLESSRSTPVCAADRLYLRGMKHLWCLSEQAPGQ